MGRDMGDRTARVHETTMGNAGCPILDPVSTIWDLMANASPLRRQRELPGYYSN